MTRDETSRSKRPGAVFRSSRRVTFIMRSESTSRRWSSSRLSRDPMGSVQVDVRETVSNDATPLGLDGDWGVVADVARHRAPTFLTLGNGAPDGDISAAVAVREGKAYIAYVPADKAGASVSEILLDDDLYDLVRSARAAIELDLEEGKTARLLPYKTVADILTFEADEEPETPKAPEKALPIAMPDHPATPEVEQFEPKPSAPADTSARLRALTSPKTFPPDLRDQLSAGLAEHQERFEAALLFAAEYVDGHTEFLVAFWGADAADETWIENAVNTVLTGYRGGSTELGLTFLAADDPMVVRISRVGQRLA